MGSELKLFLGLGNPGPQYKLTRHNVGFLVIDQLLANWKPQKEDANSLCWWAEVKIHSQSLLLAKPLTYMNLSGQAAWWLQRQFKLLPSEILIIHDDLDLDWGQIKLVSRAGSGGHKGVVSIQETLGTTAIPRLRIGIGRPPQGTSVVDYVLSPFSSDELKELPVILDCAFEVLQATLKIGLHRAISQFGRRRCLR